MSETRRNEGLPLPAGVASVDPVPLPRREFLALASGCVVCGLASSRVRAATDRPIDAGTLKDYPADGISEKFIQHDVFMIRHEGKLFACTAVCPHKANYLLVDPKQADRIICSGHDSIFNPAGIPQSGPARRALERYGITVNAQGRVVVDTSRSFRQPQWTDPASYVALV
jgi:nitrite reductase/ring-hydroxylating ferredoxin subunit